MVTRIGGAARLREILDRFYARLFDDILVGFFFFGHDRAKIVDGQLGFLLWAFGHTDVVPPRHPTTAHDDLAPILRGHIDRRLVVLREVLDEAQLERGVIAAWLRIERAMSRKIVRPAPRTGPMRSREKP